MLVKSRKQELQEKFGRQIYSKALHVNPTRDNGSRWVENIGTAWRFADRGGRYYIDEYGDEAYEAAIYQLPTHKGKSVFFYGYADPYNDDCAFGGFAVGYDASTVLGWAEDNARRAAEEEREYQEIWQEGRKYAEAFNDVLAARSRWQGVRRALREVRESIGRGFVEADRMEYALAELWFEEEARRKKLEFCITVARGLAEAAKWYKGERLTTYRDGVGSV